MTGHKTEPPVFYLKAGDILVTEKPFKVSTVLGSCVSVTMFSRRFKIAAICHALMPVCIEKASCLVSCAAPFKYVNCVVPDMVRRMQSRGVSPKEIETKLFGGSDMFGPGTDRERALSVGNLNIEAAVSAVRAENLVLKVTDVGGEFGRKIFFYTNTGEVWLKHLK
ncbi:MAG: chemotaxis protein CheD [Desulfobacterales bacterium]|nr:chemotaxis protein CheD [Desulfobacterales bacterium]